MPCKRRSSVNGGGLMTYPESLKPIFCLEQGELTGRKIILLQKVILHYGKRSIFKSFIIFDYLSFTTARGQKNGFNSCECIKLLNIANFHAFHVWWKRILSCNDTTFFLHFFHFFAFATQLISTPVKSSNLRNQPPLYTELRFLQGTLGYTYIIIIQ